MKRAVTVGDTCIDYYEGMDRWYPTGNCVDFAVNLADLGGEVSIVSRVGKDRYGESVRKLLRRHGVFSRYVSEQEGRTPMTRMTLGGPSGKDRIHGSFDEGVMKDFCLQEEELAFILTHQFVHTHLYGRADRYLPVFKENGQTVIYDFSTSWDPVQHREAEKYVDYGIYSWKQDDALIRRYLRESVLFSDMKAAIATLGEEGSICCMRSGETEPALKEEDRSSCRSLHKEAEIFEEDGVCYVRQPAVYVPEDKLVNTVGAGDSFIAGFVRGLQEEREIADCMACGAETAARIVQVFEPFLPCEEKESL